MHKDSYCPNDFDKDLGHHAFRTKTSTHEIKYENKKIKLSKNIKVRNMYNDNMYSDCRSKMKTRSDHNTYVNRIRSKKKEKYDIKEKNISKNVNKEK